MTGKTQNVFRPQPIRAHHRSTHRFAVAFLGLAIAFSQISCVPTASGCLEGDPSCSTADWIGTVAVDHPHFEFVEAGLTISKDFWLVKDEQLLLKWTDFAYLFHAPNETCDFAAATIDKTKCQRCRWCNQIVEECGATFAIPSSAGPLLIAYSEAPVHRVLDIQVSPSVGCRNGYAFTPPENSTVEIRVRPTLLKPLEATRAFVLTPGAGQTVTYELQKLDQTLDPGAEPAKFFSGTVPQLTLPNGPGLEDNFSSHLQITKVRVLKVRKQKLPLKNIAAQDAIPLKPSRLVFITNFRNGDPIRDRNRCYGDPAVEDRDFDLTNCREIVGGPRTLLEATPAYLGSSKADLLTWIAEFKESEGGVFPTYDPDTEMVVIEFTIEASVVGG